MSQEQQIKELIKQEYLKCLKEPDYFMSKYCQIQHQDRGRIPFVLYPFQGKVLRLWRDNKNSIVLKSRQLGISTLAAGYALWLMLFNKDKNVVCIATKSETAKNMITKVRIMFDGLPSWLKIPVDVNNKLSLNLSNGSGIIALSAASDSARSFSAALLIIDEAAFIDGIGEIWASAQQTLATVTSGQAIVLSTPYGTGNWFHSTWVKAETGENNFLPIKLPWYLHPERDEQWRKDQDAELGDPRLAAQECDAEFLTSGDLVFYSEFLDYYEKTFVEEPIEIRGTDKNLWIWERVDYNKNYMVVADVARGDGKDSSTFHIIDIENNKQVGEYKGQPTTKEFGHILVAIATEYNNALLVVENNNIGWAVIQTIQELNYNNLYYSPKSDSLDVSSYIDKYNEDLTKMTPGFYMSPRVRPLVIGKFQEYVNSKSITIKSKRCIEEMKVFIWKNGKAEAQAGYNDDLVMPMGVGMYLRDTALKFKQQNSDLARAALQNITVTKHTTGGYNSNKFIQNPYSQNINGRDESLRWLL